MLYAFRAVQVWNLTFWKHDLVALFPLFGVSRFTMIIRGETTDFSRLMIVVTCETPIYGGKKRKIII